jgi:small subunit ribosomal protein S20
MWSPQGPRALRLLSCRAAFRQGGSPQPGPHRARGHHTAAQTSAIDTEEHHRMANIKSQIKRIKTNEKRRVRNKSVKSSVKTAIRKFREAAEAGDKEKADILLRDASKKLDKAASKGVIHRNQAANKKSAMAKRANQLAN